MLAAEFFEFSKRDNSTLRPVDGTGRVYKIGLKENCSLNRPDIVLYLGTALVPYWNYIHIPELSRYYFVDSWEWIQHKNWVAHCTIDVLATYKSQIGEQTLYVLRSASRRDTNIVDMLYPAKADVTFSTSVMNSPWMYNNDVAIDHGCFIIGCDSESGHFGSVNYYVVTPTQLTQICTYLTSKFVSESKGFTITDASIALQNSLVNPMQFIRSCMWYPFPKTSLAGIYDTEAVKIYDQTITYEQSGVDLTLTGGVLTEAAIYRPSSLALVKLTHPQYLTNGDYMNCDPFTEVQLKIPPLGVIDLDATVLNNVTNPFLDFTVDLITGKVIIEVKTGTVTLNRLSTQLGVPIQLSQVTRDYQGVVNNAVGAVKSALSLDFLGAANGIYNSLASAAPKASSIGSNGGYADLYGDIELMYKFYTQTAVNNDEHGRPLMQTVRLNTLSGYIEVEQADINIPCSSEELTMIKAFLTGGFFYE